METGSTEKKRKRKTYFMNLQKIGVVSIFLLSLILSIAFFAYEDYFREASSLGLLGLFIVNFVSSATFFISAPAFLSVISGGNLYSPILVSIVASFGAGLGDLVGFLFGHSGRRLTMKKFEANSRLKLLEKLFQKHGMIVIFIMALIPNPFFDFIGILAGALNYSLAKFFITMITGRFLRYWLLAQFGANL